MNTGFVFDVALHKIKLLLTSFNHLTFARELLQHSIGRSVFDALKLAIEARSCLAKVGYLFCMGYPQPVSRAGWLLSCSGVSAVVAAPAGADVQLSSCGLLLGCLLSLPVTSSPVTASAGSTQLGVNFVVNIRTKSEQ